MEINLSAEVINTVYNSLRCSKQTLNRQLKTKDETKREIIESQLDEVEWALQVFEEMMDRI